MNEMRAQLERAVTEHKNSQVSREVDLVNGALTA